MFFVIPKDSESIENWELSMVLKGAVSSKTVPLKYQLSGEIPKRNSTNQEKST